MWVCLNKGKGQAYKTPKQHHLKLHKYHKNTLENIQLLQALWELKSLAEEDSWHIKPCTESSVTSCASKQLVPLRSWEITWASKQRLTVAMGEWHHEEYSATNKSRPAEFMRDCFKRALKSDSSCAVRRITFSACTHRQYHIKPNFTIDTEDLFTQMSPSWIHFINTRHNIPTFNLGSLKVETSRVSRGNWPGP